MTLQKHDNLTLAINIKLLRVGFTFVTTEQPILKSAWNKVNHDQLYKATTRSFKIIAKRIFAIKKYEFTYVL